jgi:hypothetical protein
MTAQIGGFSASNWITGAWPPLLRQIVFWDKWNNCYIFHDSSDIFDEATKTQSFSGLQGEGRLEALQDEKTTVQLVD